MKKGLTSNYTIRIVMVMEGKELLKIRRELDLTQVQMADQIGVAPNTVARWERGELKISEPVSRLIHLLASAKPTQARKTKTKGA